MRRVPVTPCPWSPRPSRVPGILGWRITLALKDARLQRAAGAGLNPKAVRILACGTRIMVAEAREVLVGKRLRPDGEQREEGHLA